MPPAKEPHSAPQGFWQVGLASVKLLQEHHGLAKLACISPSRWPWLFSSRDADNQLSAGNGQVLNDMAEPQSTENCSKRPAGISQSDTQRA
jgi:hypothetical protein